MKTNLFNLKDFFYLFSLYFKRGKGITLFYIIMLILGLILPGFLLESNAKISSLITEIDKKLPPNRVKLVIPPNVRSVANKGFMTQIFKLRKNNAQPKPNVKYKDFITAAKLNEIKNLDGVGHIVPLYSIDFPMGIVFAIPGTNTPIQMQMIGSGISAPDAKPYIYESSKIKDFNYVKGQPVPVMMSSFIVPILNTIVQNNGVSDFKFTAKDLVGIRIKVFVGRSELSDTIRKSGNGDEKTFNTIDSAKFSDTVECQIVGFIDMDYTLGLAFPQSFLDQYKKVYWGNFKPGNYDSLVVDVPFNKTNGLKNQFIDKGFELGSDTGLLNKISYILQQQQQGFGLFLSLISFVIVLFSMIILFYTVLWILRGKTLEFAVYQFFGASRAKVVWLYNSYLTTLNLIAFLSATIILKVVFFTIKEFIMPLKSHIPPEFQSIFNAPFLNSFVVVGRDLFISFIFLEVISFFFVYFYIKRLNNKM